MGHRVDGDLVGKAQLEAAPLAVLIRPRQVDAEVKRIRGLFGLPFRAEVALAVRCGESLAIRADEEANVEPVALAFPEAGDLITRGLGASGAARPTRTDAAVIAANGK